MEDRGGEVMGRFITCWIGEPTEQVRWALRAEGCDFLSGWAKPTLHNWEVCDGRRSIDEFAGEVFAGVVLSQGDDRGGRQGVRDADAHGGEVAGAADVSASSAEAGEGDGSDAGAGRDARCD